MKPTNQTNRAWQISDKLGIEAEWTGLGLGKALRKAEDRDEWRKVMLLDAPTVI